MSTTISQLNSLDPMAKTTGEQVANPEHVETAKELAQRLEKEVEEYKQYIDTIDDPKQLEKEEEKCIKELEEFDKHIKAVAYPIPDSTVFEGKRYSRSDVAGMILYFIGKSEVQWQYTKGLYDLCNVWKNITRETLSYGELDSSLRMLENCKFRGYEEWRNILIVNEYMKALHEDYAKDLALQIAISQKHNAVLERMDLTSKVTTDTNHEAE